MTTCPYPVSTVAAIIVRDGCLLLIRRGTPPGLGQWSVPGGKVEWGERLPAALQREVREETGLLVEVGALADVSELLVEEDSRVRFHYILIDYFATATGGTLAPGSDVTDARWVPFADLPTLDLTPTLHPLLQKLGMLATNEG